TAFPFYADVAGIACCGDDRQRSRYIGDRAAVSRGIYGLGMDQAGVWRECGDSGIERFEVQPCIVAIGICKTCVRKRDERVKVAEVKQEAQPVGSHFIAKGE